MMQLKTMFAKLKTLTVRRYEGDSPDGFLMMTMSGDGDVWLSVHPTEQMGYKKNVRFCGMNGGGHSPKTREALINLFTVIATENREDFNKGRLRGYHSDDMEADKNGD